MLTPYPGVLVVLTTDWVLNYGFRKAARELPAGLRSRVVGSVYDDQPAAFFSLCKAQQVVSDVKRRKPRRWLAVETSNDVWPSSVRRHVLLTGRCSGIVTLAAKTRLLERLEELAA
jgi:hypothetical protein